MDYEHKRMQIINQIISARISKGITQAQLAEKLGTQRSNICRLETGRYNPTLDWLIRLGNALDLDLDLKLEEREVKPMPQSYELRLYDEVLLQFTLEQQTGLGGLRAEIREMNEPKKKLFPLDMTLTGEGIVKWLERRVIPKNREFVTEILKSLNLALGDTKGIIDVCKGLSLNDSYWVVPAGFSGTFAEYNLYDNRFSEILSLVAYTGAGQGDKAFSTSPELTTNGMLPKAWRFIEQDGIYLYKGGTSGAVNTGNEPYCEHYASQIAAAIGLNAITYELENWKGILASKCALFTNKDTAYLPIGSIIKEGGLPACIDFYKRLGTRFSEHLASMLVFDAVIYNEDRHFGNFGVLRDNHTGEIIAPAPVFDNGFSLFNFAMPEDIKQLDAYAATRAPYYPNISFEMICKEVMGKKQMQQLRKLIGFKFKRTGKINWPEERLAAIEQHIEKRARQLLELPRARMVKEAER